MRNARAHSWKKFVSFSVLLITLGWAINSSTTAFGQTAAPKYSQVRIYINSNSDFATLADAGLIFDHVDNHGTYLDTVLNDSDLAILKATSWRYTILTD